MGPQVPRSEARHLGALGWGAAGFNLLPGEQSAILTVMFSSDAAPSRAPGNIRAHWSETDVTVLARACLGTQVLAVLKERVSS